MWLDPAAARRATGSHSIAAQRSSLRRATLRFALALSLPDLAALPAGSHEAPENSATLILQIARFGSRARAFAWPGPGLREPTLLAVDGLPADFAAVWQRNHALYPRGVDIILCAGTTLAALPRSVSIEEA